MHYRKFYSKQTEGSNPVMQAKVSLIFHVGDIYQAIRLETN